MPTTTEQPTVPRKRRFTVDEYYRMADAGVFTTDDRVELLDGQIYVMAPIGSEHAACVRRLNRLFQQRVASRALVSVQSPVRLSEKSEPEPDVALLRPRNDEYAARHPQPEDVLLLIEVADTSLAFDRDVKCPLYAQAGISELWIVNLSDDCLEAYRTAREHRFSERQTYERGQSVPIPALPDVDSVSVDEVLGTQ